MDRREFLGLVGGAAAGITLGRLGGPRVLPPRVDPSEPGPGGFALPGERLAIGVCDGCPAGCSVRLRVIDGNLVGISGNPACPQGRGGLCPRGVSEVEAFYDPDRLLGSVRREGPRGGGKLVPVRHEAALGTIAKRVRALVDAGKGARIGAILSSAPGSRSAAVAAALAAFGSPHVYHVPLLRDEAAAQAAGLFLGIQAPPAYDLERTRLIVSFWTPLFDGFLGPTFVGRTFGDGRRADPRLRLVQVSSRHDRTAGRADSWIRCKAGTEATVALAVAAELIRRGRAVTGALAGEPDRAAADAFMRRLTAKYDARAVQAETGVGASDVAMLARLISASPRFVAIGERLAGSAGPLGMGAVLLLNALGGALGREGGVVSPPAPAVAAVGDGTGGEGRGARLDGPGAGVPPGTQIWRVLAGLQARGAPPPFDILFIEDGAAMGDVVQGDPAWEMLGRIPLVVSFATGLDASAQVADLILPATTSYEQAIDVEVRGAGGFTAVSAARPALPRLVAGHPIEDMMLGLARPHGGPKLDDAQALVRFRLGGLAAGAAGGPYGRPGGGGGGATRPAAAGTGDRRAAVEAILDAGGWVARFDPTGAGVEPLRMRIPGNPPATASPLFAGGAGSAWPLPEPELPPAGSTGGQRAEITLRLVPFSSGTLTGRGTPNRPMMLELAGPTVDGAFRPWVELNPIDARRMAVANHDTVRVRMGSARVVLPVRVNAGVRPGTVAIPSAPAARGTGRYAAGWRPGAERLIASVHAPISGARVAAGMRVALAPAGGTA